METEQLMRYLMFTPMENLPAMPSHIHNEQNVELGMTILQLLKKNQIKIDGMDSNGLLRISTFN